MRDKELPTFGDSDAGQASLPHYGLLDHADTSSKIIDPVRSSPKIADGNNFRCPQCGSESTAAFGMIHQGGTTSGSFQALSYGSGTGLVGTGGRTSGRTGLAAQTAPPRRPGMSGWDLLISFVIFIVLLNIGMVFHDIVGLIISVAGVGGYVYLRNKQVRLAKALWTDDVIQWNRSWMCLRCGRKFMVNTC